MMTVKKQRAAYLLALGEATQTEIALQVGVTDRTIRNWLQDPPFQVAISELVKKVRLQMLAKAFSRLTTILKDGDDRQALVACHMVFKMAGLYDKGPPKAVSARTEPSGIVYLPHNDPRWQVHRQPPSIQED